jgi:putative transposase
MSFHGILVHVIFSTQYRKRLLADTWRDELFAIIGDQVKEHKGALLQAGGIEDHIHLFLKTHPSFAIADTIRLLKANSSHWINETNRITGKFHWQKGYAAFSVSQSVAESVRNYIRNQVEHHKTKSFQEEYLEFLDRHNIVYDLAYVFEEDIVS